MKFSILFTVLALSIVIANAKIPCDKWKGPDTANKIEDCDIQGHLMKTYADSILGPIVLAIITIVVIPFFLAGRYCCKCCGSYNRRPGTCCCGGAEWDMKTPAEKEAAYPRNHVQIAKWFTVGVLVLGVVGFCCCVAGATQLNTAYDNTWKQTDGVMDWLNGKEASIRTKLTKPDGTLVAGINATYFDNLRKTIADLRGDKNKLRTSFEVYWNGVVTAAYVLGVVPLVFFVFGCINAVCNIRKGGPLSLICTMWIVGTLFWILACAFGVTYMVLNELCDEVGAQKTKSPGIIQWKVVPDCIKTIPLKSAKDDVAKAETDNSLKACQAMFPNCDATDFPTTPQKVNVCPYIVNTATRCDSFLKATAEISATSVKSSAPQQCATVPNAQCTLRKCSTDCTDTNLRDTTKSTLSLLDDAGRALDALTKDVFPMLDCNVLIDKAFEVFGECDAFVKTTATLKAGVIIYAIASWALVVAMALGQKRFIVVDAAGMSVDAVPTSAAEGQEMENKPSDVARTTDPYAQPTAKTSQPQVA